MTFVSRIVFIFLFCVLFKIQYNYRRYKLTLKIKDKYLKWLDNEKSVSDMNTYKSIILKLFKDAKINDVHLPTTTMIGRDKAASYQFSIYQNLLYRTGQVVANVCDMFDEAIGYYRSAYKESFNPLYWIEVIILLPKHIMEYFGMNMEKLNTKIVHVIFTGIWWLICIFFTCFKSEIFQLIQSLLQKLAQS